MPEEREVAGIRCGEVLARLGAYVDGELAPEECQRIEAHLAGCNWCESFGTEYSRTVTALRAKLAPAEALSEDAKERLRDRLNE